MQRAPSTPRYVCSPQLSGPKSRLPSCAISPQAVAQRKKFVSVELVPGKGNSAEAWRTAVGKLKPMRTWKGKLNESHRLYVLSADLAWEAIEGTKPWEAVTPASEQSLTGVVEWLLCLTLSASDFVILWDGRRRKWRHLLESKLETRQYSELWISFSGRTNALRTGRYRRTALNAQNKECGFLLVGCAGFLVTCLAYFSLEVRGNFSGLLDLCIQNCW